jgi:hypothetical protein
MDMVARYLQVAFGFLLLGIVALQEKARYASHQKDLVAGVMSAWSLAGVSSCGSGR